MLNLVLMELGLELKNKQVEAIKRFCLGFCGRVCVSLKSVALECNHVHCISFVCLFLSLILTHNSINNNRMTLLVSRGQTAYFSFGVGAEKNKGLAYYHCMFCAENRQILAIVDWQLISVNSLQRCSTRMTYKAVYKVYEVANRLVTGRTLYSYRSGSHVLSIFWL